jgi:peptidoglycan/LPS O-acetylase OafA/YrhL
MPITHAWHQDAPIWREKAYLPCMSAIAAGVVAAVVARAWTPRSDRDRALQVAGVAAMTGPLVFGDLLWPVLGEGTLLVLVTGAALFVLGAHGDRDRAPSPLTAPLRSFGRLSYEVYLTHMFVVFAVVEAFAVLGLGKREGGWAYPLALGGSWALGRLFSTTVAAPGRKAMLRRLGVGSA